MFALAVILMSLFCDIVPTGIIRKQIHNAIEEQIGADLSHRTVKTIEKVFVKPSGGSARKPLQFKCPPSKTPVIDDVDALGCKEIPKDLRHLSHPDRSKLTPEILEMYGYKYLEYQIHTKDGYILTVYRITSSPNPKTNSTHKTPVYINHGFSASSDWWFLLPPEKTMVLMMADAGYDVWISNARGTSYSLKHEHLDYDKDLSYWDFSFHEMGIYDLPAVIKKMTDETGHHSILYVGHSMATIQLLICLSEMPEMNAKVKAAFFLAPVAHIGHNSNGLRNTSPLTETEEAYNAMNLAFRGRLRSRDDFRRLLNVSSGDVCSSLSAMCGLCDNVFFAYFSVNPPQLNRTTLALLYHRFPNSFSVKTLFHFGQLVLSCRFQKFNYWPKRNLEIYGTLTPPEYDMSKVKSPLYMYHGENDNIGPPIDVHEFIKQLNAGVLQKLVLVPDKLFTHFDFCIAKDADKLLYEGLLNDMKKYIGTTSVK